MDSAFLAKITKVELKAAALLPLFNVEWGGGSDHPLDASLTPLNTALKSWAHSQNIHGAIFNIIDGDKKTILNIEAS